MEASARQRLRRGDMAADPVEQFRAWFEAARRAGQPEPEAMALSTADREGRCSLRWVLLRAFDQRGFVFYTNGRSRKGRELASNPWAAVGFRWQLVDRQVRARGSVSQVSARQSDAYFAGRPRASQLGAWASAQSEPAEEDAMERRLEEVTARFEGQAVPRPPWWGGYRLEPVEMEFWQQGEYRMHDRFRYARDGAGWSLQRLYP